MAYKHIPKHILVAEDEQHMRHTLSLILKKAGYRVSKAGDGYEALKIIVDTRNGTRPVDLLLTDIQMPGLTGIELIAQLEQLNISLPILVITGYGDEDTVIELKYVGYAEYIEKPFTAETLLESVSRVFEKEGIDGKR
jgi:DNA-binding NtrC family response regulator